jgi:bidirectional [NiFe] hydrogenase diaphorase subunit
MSAFPVSLPKPPSDDKRWRLVDAAMRRQGYASHALIESLHAAQSAFGYLDETAMHYVARSLRVPMGKVYGVATFYHHFMLKPQGKHTCVVCMGTACYIKGAGEILKQISEKYNVKDGQTTADGELSLLSARCIGACGLAPAVVIDGDVIAKAATDQAISQIERKLVP